MTSSQLWFSSFRRGWRMRRRPIGALAGDLVRSFAKRRLAIAPGRTWFPIDQLDYIIGALIAGVPFIRLTPSQVVGVVAADREGVVAAHAPL